MSGLSVDVLLDVLRTHDIVSDQVALRSAFQIPDTKMAIQGWMESYINKETLLTKEEAAILATLCRAGDMEEILASSDIAIAASLSDLEVEAAIEELKSSTFAIEKQTEALKLQQNATTTMAKNNSSIKEKRFQTDSNQNRRWQLEKGQIMSSIEEISDTLRFRCLDLEQQNGAFEKNIKQTVEGVLRIDDKLLLSLQKLLSDLGPREIRDDLLISKLRELCARFIKHTVEGVRTRLDRIYLEALDEPEETEGNRNKIEAFALQEELESLYSEILPVSQMATEQQFLQPALREMTAKRGHGLLHAEKAVDHIYECLTFMMNRIRGFLQRVKEQRSHRNALEDVIDVAKKELKKPEQIPPRQAVAPTQILQKVSILPATELPGHRRRRYSHHLDDDIDPGLQLLRTIGLNLPSKVDSDTVQASFLEKSLWERSSKLVGHSANLQASTEATVSSSIQDAQATLQLLRDSLLAESDYGQIRLLGADTEFVINILEAELQGLQESLGSIDLRKLQVRNAHRDELVERWSR